MSTAHAFHDYNQKGLYIVQGHDLFFVPDEELNRVGYNPVQCGLYPIGDIELSNLLVQDYDGWLDYNLRLAGYFDYR